VITVVIQI